MAKMILIAIWLTIVSSEYIPPGPKYQCPKETDRYLLYPCVCEKGTDAGLYVRCENAGLAVLSVGLGNIANRGLPIEKLTLNECKISHLFGPLFHKCVIRVLEIQNTPIESIDQYTFYGTNTTLEELKMVNTKLKEFPRDALKVLGNLAILQLDGHEIPELKKDVFAGSKVVTKLQKLHVSNGMISDIPLDIFQHLKKLKTLDFHGNRITALKRNQFKGLRDTEFLDLSHNAITRIDGSHLADLTSLGWCNVSNNNIAEIPRGMFARNSLLKVLHLNGNKLKKVDTNSFKGLRFLRRLFLQDNQIASVGVGSFSSAALISTIDLARNNLTKIDYKVFEKLRYAELINLAENQIETIERQAFTELYLTKVNLSRNALSMIEVGAFENCNNMTILDLSYNNLTGIVKNAFDENSYAYEMQVSYNRFTDLSQIPIYNMTQIRILNASHNEIEIIPRNSFPKLYELYIVDVSHNKLKEIHNGIFQNLFSIRYLNLSHNKMVQIKPGTFGAIPTVLELDLSHNQLVDVSRGSLAKLVSCSILDMSYNRLERIFQIPISLSELNVAHNNLSEIRPNTWPSMNALLRLNLSSNQLADQLASDSFNGLLTLQKVDLSANMMTKPPWEALSSMSSLQYVYMMDNNLTALNRSSFGRLPTLFELDLTNNEISHISVRAFEGLQQLIKLTLSKNRLRSIPNEAFKTLVALRDLDLSHNLLEKIDNKSNGLLDDCLSLERVNLSHNSFGFLTKKMFPYDQYIPYRLYEIDLSHNRIPVLTHHFTIGAKKLKRLNVAHNRINDVRNNVLGNLTSLEVLDLSGNELTDLVSRSIDSEFKLPANMTELYMADNILKVLPVEKIANSPKLRVLDVRNNVLSSFEVDLVKKIKNDGLQVYFDGNPIRCDCFMRPLKHYINHLSDSEREGDTKYNNLTCAEPVSLENELLTKLDEDKLLCAGNIANDNKIARYGNTESFDFVTEPDVAFRHVQFAQNAIYAQWYVVAAQDIADFVLYIRDDKNAVYHKVDVPYATRHVTIDVAKKLRDVIDAEGSLELCVQARNSKNTVQNLYPNQCRAVPNNFEALPKKLVINRRSKATSNVLGMVSDSILITLCIFLGVCFGKMSDFELL